MIKKWVISLVLILATAGSVLAGVPLHFGGHDCSDMECCMTEMGEAPSHGAHDAMPEEQAGELYCFLNCSDPTLPGQTAGLSQLSPSYSASNHPVAVQAPLVVAISHLRRYRTDVSPQNSRPAYIRHLALLI